MIGGSSVYRFSKCETVHYYIGSSIERLTLRFVSSYTLKFFKERLVASHEFWGIHVMLNQIVDACKNGWINTLTLMFVNVEYHRVTTKTFQN